MLEMKIKQGLTEKRAMYYNDFTGCLKQLKKKIIEIEDRLTHEGDTINFSVNTDLLEDATMLWKASHKIYQIDGILSQISPITQKSQEDTSVCAGDTKKDNK